MPTCLKPGEMQKYLEDAAADELRGLLEDHVAICQRCRSAFAGLVETNRRVNTWLTALASPLDEGVLDVRDALERVLDRAPEAHLGRLLAPQAAETPWYRSLYENVRELIRPENLPPLELTSHPVEVKEIWGLYAGNGRARLVSVGVHIAMVTILAFGFSSPVVQRAIRQKFDLIDPNLKAYVPEKPKASAMQGGGGGGAREPLPVSKGQLPKPSIKPFVPPAIVDHPPKLAMDPSLLAPPDTPLPQLEANNWGDPLAKMLNGSNGNGSGGGMGNGTGGGVGSGNGGGFGPGSGGGVGGGVFRVGGGVSAPMVISKVDPEYSEEARKAKYSGTVLLSVIVDAEGRARDIHVVKSLGMGLDEKAMEAVAKWKFKPGLKGGQAVNVRAQIEVNFRLL